VDLCEDTWGRGARDGGVRYVAIKWMSKEREEALMREGSVCLRLAHPNVVRVLDCGRGAVVMEYLEGKTLQELMALEKMEVEEGAGVIADVLAALGYLHKEGVAHRDVAPDNVMVVGGRGVLIDLGVARRLEKEGGAAAMPATVAVGVGKWDYTRPPLRQNPSLPADAQDDLWAAAACLYALVEGKTAPVESGSQVSCPKGGEKLASVLKKAWGGGFETASAFCAELVEAFGKKIECAGEVAWRCCGRWGRGGCGSSGTGGGWL
jgi:serine/threonine protein kinase